MRALAWLALLAPCLAVAGEAPLQLAWRTPQGAELLRLDERQLLAREALPADLRTPLGSLWKLFVYAYQVDRGLPDPGYTCAGQDREEVYCCQTGERIDRDQALVKSCGLYFEPQRLGIEAGQWHDYWQARQAPDWLLDLNGLQPQRRVVVNQLLDSLATLPAQAEARRVLLDVTSISADGALLGPLGGRLRVKTWSWLADGDAQARQGGFAGWLVDGTPLWAGGAGTSQRVLRHYGEALGQVLPAPWPSEAGGCVEVALFDRYPLRSLSRADGSPVSQPGALQGHYQVTFANGNVLPIESQGELFLLPGATPRLVARLQREEYVARVLDREGAAQPVEAAKALAVAIRTYLLQNGERRDECLAIRDSSAQQRVAPRPASAAARAIAAWTADLVLAGAVVTYHADLPGSDRLVWRQAVEQAEAGLRYDAILARAFARSSLSRWDKPIAACQPLAAAEDWLQQRRRHWRPLLDAEPGYAETGEFAVCRLHSGKPHIDRERRRIYVRGLQSLQDRLDLTHEYLHLAFEAHPNGQDEHYIEGLARYLLLEAQP